MCRVSSTAAAHPPFIRSPTYPPSYTPECKLLKVAHLHGLRAVRARHELLKEGVLATAAAAA